MIPTAPGQPQAFAPRESYCHRAALPKADERDFLLPRSLKQNFPPDAAALSERGGDRFHLTSYTVFAQLWYNRQPSERSSLVLLTESGLRFVKEGAIASH